MKTVESWCDLHWAAGQAKVTADHPDVELTWDGQPLVLDLCGEHKATAPDLPLGELLAAARPASPQERRRIAPAPATRAAARKPSGGWVQPAGDEADQIREWVKAEQIMSRDDGPARLAYVGKSGQGQYFPVWLLKMWTARKAAQDAA